MLTNTEAIAGVKVLGGSLMLLGMIPAVVAYNPKIKAFRTKLGIIPEQSVMAAVNGDSVPMNSWLIYFTLPLRRN